ncbi:MAG: hypothetical protein QXI39_04875 [Candidatus Bathyarchaeia archaeon]
MMAPMDTAKLEFRYHKLSDEQKLKLLEKLKGSLEGASEVVFSYAYGSFIERDSFRDLDVAIWIKPSTIRWTSQPSWKLRWGFLSMSRS